MKRRLEQFYAAFGDKGIMFILYAFSVVVNSLLTWHMELPVIYPDEISVAGIAAFYSGKNWSAVIANTGESGYVQAVFYTLLFPLLKNPYALYKAMLIINAILISFIPLIIYHLSAKLGVARVRQKLLISISCGMYVSYIADSKFIWNETITSLLCWVMVLCFFTAWDRKTRSTRFTMSVLLGFLCALSYAANTRLLALAVALVLTVILAQTLFKEKIVNLPAFMGSIVLSFVAEYFLHNLLESRLWHGAGDDGLQAAFKTSFFGVFFSQIYAFMTSTLGLGAIAAAISAVMIFSCIREGIRRRVDTPESGTKVYEPIKHKYSLRLTLFALFQFLAVMCTSVFSAVFQRGGVSAASNFARYSDNLAPLSLFLMLVFVILYGVELKQILFGCGIYAYACLCFGLVGYPVISRAEQSGQTPVMGLMPVTLDDGIANDITGMTYIIMSSCAFALFAVLIVFVSCSRKHRAALVSTAVFGVIVLAAGYFGIDYLPSVGQMSSEKNEPYRAVFDLLYNDPQSPPIIVYEAEPELAAAIQFLAPDTKVSVLKKGERVPESCLLIAVNGVQVPFEGGSYDNVGRTNTYSVYAFGESARDFIRYSSASGKES